MLGLEVEVDAGVGGENLVAESGVESGEGVAEGLVA